MRQLFHPDKQKFIITLATALVCFFGLEAASQALDFYQIRSFFTISSALYLFLVAMQSFIFDLHLKPARTLKTSFKSFEQSLRERFEYFKHGSHWLHFQNYLILSGIIYWATISVIFMSPFNDFLKQFWIIFSTLLLSVCFWYIKTVFYRHNETNHITRQLIFITKLYASYLAFIAAFGISRYFAYGPEFFSISVFAISFLLVQQALFQYHTLGFQTLKYLLTTSMVMAICAFALYVFWNVNYYSGALALAAVYNTIWGVVHHRFISKDITREIVYEYLAVLFIVLVIVFSTTNFAERI